MSNQQFVCRVCGHQEFDVRENGCVCEGCSAIFEQPSKFSIPQIKFIKLHENAITPEKAHETDTGFDFCSCEDAIVRPFETKLIKTGIAMEFPNNIGVQIRPRSGLAKKKNVTITNSPATIDPGYRNEIGVLIKNDNPNQEFRIKEGDAIAQLVFESVVLNKVQLVEVSSDKFNKETDRGLTGYGDSGVSRKMSKGV